MTPSRSARSRNPAKRSATPKASIRRFDVFAEYNRAQAIEEGMPPDRAKGHALWLAKIVAARRFGAPKEDSGFSGHKRGEEPRRGKWHVLGDKPQTDDLFDHEIVERMGRGFYRTVFAPAIRRARDQGKTYVDIRDSIRAGWKA